MLFLIKPIEDWEHRGSVCSRDAKYTHWWQTHTPKGSHNAEIHGAADETASITETRDRRLPCNFLLSVFQECSHG